MADGRWGGVGVSGLKERVKPRAGILAFALSAVLFAIMSFLKPNQSPAAMPVLVPVVSRFVDAGTRVEPGDIHWTPESQMKPISAAKLRGYATFPLFPGEILSPSDVGNLPSHSAVVSVTPGSAADRNVLGSRYVDVLVMGDGHLIWQSGTVPVMSSNSTPGLGASLAVAMSYSQAMAFEQNKQMGRVDVIGVSP